jgi:hypothetical protein
LRWLFVRVGIAGLIGIFIALLVVAALLLSLALTLDSARPGVGFLTLWKEELMVLLSLPVEGPAANRGSGVAQSVAIAAGLIALILPALYVGAIVFRLFIHPSVFVFRSKIALLTTPETFRGELSDDGHVLAVRMYNASRMRALDVRFQVVHQHWFQTAEGPIVRNIAVDLANPDWPMADRHVPYTLFVRLAHGDVTGDGAHLALRAIKGRAVDSRDRLVVHVLGTMPEVGESFVERHAFDLSSSVTDEGYGGVDIQYGTRSRTWGGWERFDA